MRLGYMRISKSNGDQSLNLQRDALIAAGVQSDNIYSDMASGKNDDRPGLAACLKALREGDEMIIWRLDRLGRNLTHLIETINELSDRKIGFKCLTGVNIDTTTPTGRFVLTIFAGLSQFERELTRERVMAGLAAARARGRQGGRKSAFTKAALRRAQAAMQNRDTSIAQLCAELGVTKPTLYRNLTPTGELTEAGKRVLDGTSEKKAKSKQRAA
jgi:DNA invertase Pin-like site-specific DNA recombinase